MRGLGVSVAREPSRRREGKDHPDRDAQFRHISQTAREALAAGEPAISMDAKKRELVGDFKAVGREYEPNGRPVEVRCHDFKDKDLGHAIPYGVYDIHANEGYVSVGTVPSYCTSCSPCLGFDVPGVRHAVAELLLDVGSERDGEPSGGAAAGLQLAVADPVVDGVA